MAGTLPTFLNLITRYQYLIGETDVTDVNVTNNSNINQAILDILNMYDFGFARVQTTGTLTLNATGYGSFSLTSDYNPIWHIPDARIVSGITGGDNIFKEIPISDINNYDANQWVFWITYSPSTNLYSFNSNQTSGTVTYTYYSIPSTLVNNTDICIVPDAEAVAMFAVSKNWIGAERNEALAQYFNAQAVARLDLLYQKEVAFGELFSENSLVQRQPQLNGMGADPGINVEHT